MKLAKHAPELLRSCLQIAHDLSSSLTTPKPSRSRYSGAMTTQDTDRCAQAGALRLLGHTDTEIAELIHADKRSVPLMLAKAEDMGILTAAKERLTQAVTQNAELSNIALHRVQERIAHGETSCELAATAKALSTAVGVTTEKFLLLTGQATEIIEHKVTVGRNEIEAWLNSNSIPVDALVVSEPGKVIEDIQPVVGPKEQQDTSV